mmetsp:Transcript_3434/g.9871  ORF Transcript_3434/g.9871 Transcript_3434/m.9871 type:complete len:161 (+) Transcript_3434:318-800(+)
MPSTISADGANGSKLRAGEGTALEAAGKTLAATSSQVAMFLKSYSFTDRKCDRDARLSGQGKLGEEVSAHAGVTGARELLSVRAKAQAGKSETAKGGSGLEPFGGSLRPPRLFRSKSARVESTHSLLPAMPPTPDAPMKPTRAGLRSRSLSPIPCRLQDL